MDIEWRFKSFEDLTKSELHEMMILRQQVFIVEQDCPYQDADVKDKYSHHLLGYINGGLVAYLRLVKPGISYEEMSFGRIVIALTHRGSGLGIALMKEGIKQSIILYGTSNNRISAQSHLLPFYQKFGFVSTGKEYLEDDIPHTEMIKTI
ncbi:MAG: GNAT family N-acetyltransferase [Flavobacteriales bacterium]|nr:GNAT family N-acetyltransferase [Flavobacteriales bacterium]|tara:strand:- start:8378 stop:8827 length:450 start_codon:yes stop_codon:yes gene_type:complete